MADLAEPGPARAGVWRRLLQVAWRSKTPFWAGLLLAIVLLVLLAAPLLPLKDPNQLDTSVRLVRPFQSSAHWLGTDDLGRDILARIIWGGRASIVAGLAAAGISVGIGTLLGLVAGYMRGAVDSLVMRIVDILMAFPPLLLAIAIVGSLGPGLRNAVIAAGVIGIPLYARVIRGIVLVERELDYVLAARALGASGARIMWRHVTPATSSSLAVLITLDIGYKIIITAGMSFLGLGSQPPSSDWGAMLADGRSLLASAPHLATIPGLAIFVVVLSTNLLGDGLRDALDPRISESPLTGR